MPFPLVHPYKSIPDKIPGFHLIKDKTLKSFFSIILFFLLLPATAYPQHFSSGWHWLHKRTFTHTVSCSIGNVVLYAERDKLIALMKDKTRHYQGNLDIQMHSAADSLLAFSTLRDTVSLTSFASVPIVQGITESFFIGFLREKQANVVCRTTGKRVHYIRIRKFCDDPPGGGCSTLGHALFLPFHRQPFYKQGEEQAYNVKFF